MALSWYLLASILCGALLGVVFIVFIIVKCCFKKPKNYNTLIQTDDELEKEDKLLHKVDLSLSSSVESVYYMNELNADSATSEMESNEPLSAYGDFLSLQKHLKESITIQMTFFLNTKDKNIYIAGKLNNVTNSLSNTPKGQYKVHVTLLPMKRYIIKTKWYDVKKTVAIIDEYFKFLFTTNPDIKKTNLRVRVYSRHNRHALKSTACVGECFIKLSEIKEDKACHLRRAISVTNS